MAEKKSRAVVAVERIEVETRRRIFTVRGQRVVLDSDLAEFYGVKTERLTQQVRRNLDRFPEDFAFELNADEYAALTLQNASSNIGRGGRRYMPLVFTEQGALAVSGVLRSERAAEVSVAVSRAFVAMRRQLEDAQALVDRLDAVETENEELRREVEELKALTADHQADIDAMIDSHVQLSEVLEGFKSED
jgi:hypothetical protein